MSEKMQSITVRLPADVVKELAALAAKRRIDKSALLRNIVTEALTHGERDEFRGKLLDLEQHLVDLRHKLATATAGILIDLQTIPKNNPKQEKLSTESINAWVEKNMMRP